MTSNDFTKYTNFAEEISLEVGKILHQYYGKLENTNIAHKGKYDLVTTADKEAEKYIVAKIEQAFPLHDIHGEEFTNKKTGSDYVWYIDPLDGTTNFVHSHPFFGVSIGLSYAGEMISGVVHVPILKETFTATKSKGAFLNGKRICISSTKSLEKSLLATGFPYAKAEIKNNNLSNFNDILLQVQGIRRCGAAAIDICYVACGRYDGFWELCLEPHDVAAASLVVTEAGGKMSDFTGGNDYIFSKNVIATNGNIHRILQDRLVAINAYQQ